MKERLKEFGLSDNEVEIYLALLKIGICTANRLAEITGIKRSTTYDNLNLLISKGIVSKVMRNKVHNYKAAEPKKLVHLMEERKEKIKRLVPALNSLKETISEKTGVTYYEGKKGVLTVLNDILDQNKELWFYGSRKTALIAFKHYPENFLVKRVKQKMKLRAILAEEDRNDPTYNDNKVAKLSNLRYLKSLNGSLTNIFIYAGRVALMTSSKNPTGIIIHNKEILAQQKNIFEILWKTAKI